MTRKDYVAIGEAMRNTHQDVVCGLRDRLGTDYSKEELIAVCHYDRLVESICDVFKANNPRFDRDNFKKFVGAV
jgi:hypothetical protein